MHANLHQFSDLVDEPSLTLGDFAALSRRVAADPSLPRSRGARRRAVQLRSSAVNTALLVGLLGAQGCKTVGGPELDMTSGSSSAPPPASGSTQQPAPSAPVSASARVIESGETLMMTKNEVLAAVGVTEFKGVKINSVEAGPGVVVTFSKGVYRIEAVDGFVGDATLRVVYTPRKGARTVGEIDVKVRPEGAEADGDMAPPASDGAMGAMPEENHKDATHNSAQGGDTNGAKGGDGHGQHNGQHGAAGAGTTGDAHGAPAPAQPAPVAPPPAQTQTPQPAPVPPHNGSAGHSEGGHSMGGHSSGGHSTGGNSTGGNSTGGHSSGGHSSGGHSGQPTPGGAMQEGGVRNSSAGDGGHNHANPHIDDPAKAAEHMAVLALVPVNQATHVATRSGSWFDPSIWANGQVPGNGAKVLIPDGVSVLYNGKSTASIFTVRVDGDLNFATDRDTFMEVDTLVVAPGGSMTVGTLNNPVDANVSAIISIANNGPINVSWDPMLLSRGIVSHGNFEIHGAEKTSHLKVAVDPMRGDTTLTLAEAPAGWKVGDKLVLTGTHLVPVTSAGEGTLERAATQDEELTITRIDGKTVYLDRALSFNHDTPRDDLKAYVSNMTRNVRIESENASAIPVHQRGHVMLMHSDDIDVRYAEFHQLGRTDKSVRAFDRDDLSSVQSNSNLKGRYPLHIHKAGVSDLNDPVFLIGNAVWGSPGWGIVHHESNAVIDTNSVYNVTGASFVAESGNETGRWVNNIAIKAIGVDNLNKDERDVDAFDLGRTGVGYWFQSRLVSSVDNVAAGMPSGFGFVYFHRANQGDDVPVDSSTFLQSDAFRYASTVLMNVPPINQFHNNEALAVYMGLEVIKETPEQGHDIQSVFNGFKAWEVAQGVGLQYTSRYTLINFDLVSANKPNFIWEGASFGFGFGTNVFDITIVDTHIDGFRQGVGMEKKTFIGAFNPARDSWGYTFIDVTQSNTKIPYSNTSWSDRFLTASDLVDGRLDFSPLHSGIPLSSSSFRWNDGFIDWGGIKTDSIGAFNIDRPYDDFLLRTQMVQGAAAENGYWMTKDGKYVTLIEEYITDRATGDIAKVGLFVEIPKSFNIQNGGFTSSPAVYNGILDEGSRAPVAMEDIARVKPGHRIVIDVLGNDYDPDGDKISLDGLQAGRGYIAPNADGTVTYIADENWTGKDTFYYWVEDEHGNFTKGTVTVIVEV